MEQSQAEADDSFSAEQPRAGHVGHDGLLWGGVDGLADYYQEQVRVSIVYDT